MSSAVDGLSGLVICKFYEFYGTECPRLYQSMVLYPVLHSYAMSQYSMFHNPTAAVNLFHVGKQYLTFCKA